MRIVIRDVQQLAFSRNSVQLAPNYQYKHIIFQILYFMINVFPCNFYSQFLSFAAILIKYKKERLLRDWLVVTTFYHIDRYLISV